MILDQNVNDLFNPEINMHSEEQRFSMGSEKKDQQPIGTFDFGSEDKEHKNEQHLNPQLSDLEPVLGPNSLNPKAKNS